MIQGPDYDLYNKIVKYELYKKNSKILSDPVSLPIYYLYVYICSHLLSINGIVDC